MLRFLTAGESHGKCLVGIIEGLPANITIDINKVNHKLSLRQNVYGRGQRMKIEIDQVEILSGVRSGKTLGSPICIKIENKDWPNWKDIMSIEDENISETITKPRPGHADLPGALKYNQTDIRNILERASARETSIRTAVGSIIEQFLDYFKVKVHSHVIQIGNVKLDKSFDYDCEFLSKVNDSQVRCGDKEVEKEMIKYINDIREKGDSVGGVFEVAAFGIPAGLGSCMHWDRKLNARIAYGLMSIQAVKGVEFGLGFNSAYLTGYKMHDEIYYSKSRGYFRKTNNSGGIEGGISNGEPIIVRAVIKPIPTLYKPLNSINMSGKEACKATVERSDICVVPAASIVGQTVVAWELGAAIIEKFGGDSIEETYNNYSKYINYLKTR